MALLLLYPQISTATETAARDPGCNVPRGYDCATPGYERPVTLDEAIDISKRETVVYLYGKGIQSVDTAAFAMRAEQGSVSIPAVAVPGVTVPKDAFHIVILGHVIKHRTSGSPVEFRQRFIDRGEVFVLTNEMHKRISAQNVN
ncbi:hypothetical protein QMT40_000390 [Parvibaculaceae bacterium PLY_AMNH_Bact1]|nr:hypothetical protein QMT40_000390 [Parvibaculaceae bacterium PLY_AMNH_Bact1]